MRDPILNPMPGDVFRVEKDRKDPYILVVAARGFSVNQQDSIVWITPRGSGVSTIRKWLNQEKFLKLLHANKAYN